MNRKAILFALLLLAPVGVPVQADIIPNEPDPNPGDPEARQVVRSRLDRLGVDPIEARMILESLEPEEIQYFAESKNANVVVAGLWMEEWIGAIIYAAIVWPTMRKTWYRYVLLDEP